MSLNSDDLEMVQNVAEARQLSLRTVERVVTCIAIARTFTPENYLWLHPILSGLCVLKIVDVPSFQRTLRGVASLDELRNAFSYASWSEDARQSTWIIDWWTYCLAENETDFPDLDWKGFRSHLFRLNVRDRKDIVRFMAHHIDRLQIPQRG